MRWGSGLLVVSMLLAGCAGTGADEPHASSDPSPSWGSIAGTVIDQAVRPVEGALVAVDGGNDTISDADGRFFFPRVAPGEHRIGANRTGFVASEATIVVVAGQIADVRLRMDAVREAEPYTEGFKVSGLIFCGFALRNAAMEEQGTLCPTRGLPAVPPELDSSDATFPVETMSDVVGVWFEMAWEAGTSLADEMEANVGYQWQPELGNNEFVKHGLGPSPVVLRIPIEDFEADWEEQPSDHCDRDRCDVYVFARPGARGGPDVGWFGFAINQDYEMFLTVFHNGVLPTDFEGFTGGTPIEPPE